MYQYCLPVQYGICDFCKYVGFTNVPVPSFGTIISTTKKKVNSQKNSKNGVKEKPILKKWKEEEDKYK